MPCNVCSMMGSPCPLHEDEIDLKQFYLLSKSCRCLYAEFQGELCGPDVKIVE